MMVKIIGHNVEVIETTDENLLKCGDGNYDCANLTIHIRSTIAPTAKDMVFFHELYEMLLAFMGTSYDHHDFSRFSNVLWGTLRDNMLINSFWR